MALSVKKGTWTAGGSTPQAVSGVGFTPKALLVWTTGPGAGGTIMASAILSIGFGTRRGGVTQTRCMSNWYQDNVATSSASRRWDTTLLHVQSGEAATDYTVSLNSFDADGFTVAYSSAANANGDTFHYLAIGGADLTDANVVEDSWPNSGATFDIAGFGFQPDAIVMLTGYLSGGGAGASLAHSNMTLGVITDGRAVSIGTTGEDGQTMASAMNNNSIASSSTIAMLGEAADAIEAEANFNSWTADGVSLNNTNAPGTNRIIFALGLKGGQYNVGMEAAITGSGNDKFAAAAGGPQFTPRGALLFRSRGLTDATINSSNSLGFGLGAFSDALGSSEGASSFAGVETINTQADRVTSTSIALYDQMDTNPAVQQRIAQPVSLDSDSAATVSWSIAGTAWLTGVFVMGDAAGAAATDLAPSPVVAITSIAAPTLAHSLTLMPSPVVAATAIAAPTVVRAYTLTPSPAVATTAIAAPTLTHSLTLTPSPAVATTAVAAPTVARVYGLAPSPVVATTSVAAPTITRFVALAPMPVVTVTSIATPTVSVPTAISLTPSPVAASATVAAPSLTHALTLTPSPAVAITTVGAPTVAHTKTLSPSPVVAVTSISSPTLAHTKTLAPSPVVAITTVAAPTLVHTLTLAPAPATAVTTIGTPEVSQGGGAAKTFTPDPVIATTAVAAPAITHVLTLTPNPAVASTAVAAPSLALSNVLTPSPVVATTSVAAPSVLLAFALSPSPVIAVTTVAAPSLAHVFTLTPLPTVAATSIAAPSISIVEGGGGAAAKIIYLVQSGRFAVRLSDAVYYEV